MCPTSSIQKVVPRPGYCGRQLVITQRHTAQLSGRTTTRKGNRQGNTQLKYFLDETDELIKLRDYTERDIANRREGKIIGKLSNLISQAEELKIDHGVSP